MYSKTFFDQGPAFTLQINENSKLYPYCLQKKVLVYESTKIRIAQTTFIV